MAEKFTRRQVLSTIAVAPLIATATNLGLSQSNKSEKKGHAISIDAKLNL